MPQAADINLLAKYLAFPQILNLVHHEPVDCIVICASQVLLQAEILFRTLEDRPGLTKCLVIAGGIGHSTQALYDAVGAHPRFKSVAIGVEGLPESRVIEKILSSFFDVPQITSRGCKILYEDQSTNCGSNAIEARRVLELHGLDQLNTIVVIQDPTMLLRTCASFERAYHNSTQPKILGCPVYVPQVQDNKDHDFDFVMPPTETPGLWSKLRFLDLLLGEIARLRDDANGYGPRGKDFIKHIDIPEQIEAAFERVLSQTTSSRLISS